LFFRKRDELQAAGFPKPDPLTGRYIKADVDAWVERRRQIGAAMKAKNETTDRRGPNFDEL